MLRPIVVLLALMPAPALAQGIFDPASGGAVCYVRHYSEAHLAGHKEQQVTQIGVVLDRSQADSDPVLRLEFWLRPGERRAEITACCTRAGRALDCEVEGDAGNFRIEPGKGGALLMSVGEQGIGLEDERGFVTLNADRGDDREFLIPPQDGMACTGFSGAG